MSAPREHPRAPSLERYRAIHEHAELELELAGRGEIGQLAELSGRWPALIDGLPSVPPPAALPLLEHARLLGQRTRIELLRARELVLAQMATVTRGKRAASGYAEQLPRPRRLSRSA